VQPLSLAYTSAPFRGLDLLVELCEAELASEKALTAEVFSSMEVYAGNDAPYQPLYERIERSPGMRWVGSVGQQALADALRSLSIFAYPNTYPETFCIAAAEAMAAGCYVVTSAMGALPEVTGGFAILLPPPGDRAAYRRAFAAALRGFRDELAGPGAGALRARLCDQIRFAREHYSWARLAPEWERLLARAAAGEA
jgi:glycosyltransferase involved in cell wall biosynthesis